jgi:hypothetical protein
MIADFDWSSFIELPNFTAQWGSMGCTDGDLRTLQLDLLASPTSWPVVPRAGGWRKARFAPPSWGRGKSGGIRVYYAVLPEFGLIFLGTAFSKSAMSDLIAKDKKALAELLVVYERILKENR